jgi:DNA-binding ferritin-like protein (Dps family)
MAKWRDEKKRYQQYKARKKQLPAHYQEAIDAVERYALQFGPGSAETLVPMLEDLVRLFENGAADDTPIRSIVGDDPAQFVEDFLRNYPVSDWISTERQRLADAIDRAASAGDAGQDVVPS